jgi:hypothetical protein
MLPSRSIDVPPIPASEYAELIAELGSGVFDFCPIGSNDSLEYVEDDAEPGTLL